MRANYVLRKVRKQRQLQAAIQAGNLMNQENDNKERANQTTSYQLVRASCHVLKSCDVPSRQYQALATSAQAGDARVPRL